MRAGARAAIARAVVARAVVARAVVARAVVGGLVVGLVALSAAFAGIAIKPPGSDEPEPKLPDSSDVARAAGLDPTSTHRDEELSPAEVVRVAGSKVRAPSGGRTPAGTFLVGAARASLRPAPTLFGGQRWQQSGCTTIDEGHLDQDHLLPEIDPSDPVMSVEDIRSWPATGPDCIYLGGFGIGPARYAKAVGHGGVWVRAVAISNGTKTVVYAIADAVGWFARYDLTVCDDCGIRDVRQRLATDLGTDIGAIVVGSTHSHATADTYGGWGGIPRWYRDQIASSAVAAVKQAVKNLTPSTLVFGETHLRNRNNERRDTYYSTADTAATWLQGRSLPDARSDGRTPIPSRVVATFATYAAHPTIVSTSVLHADWPGAASRRFESVYGGVGMVFEGGLGNVSVSTMPGKTEELEAEATGRAIADDIARSVTDDAATVESNDIATSVHDISHPVSTNPGLVTLATLGFFDREFLPGTPGADVPGVYKWSKSGPDGPGFIRGCETAGPALKTTVGAHRVGEVLIAFAPGEIFSNVAEVIRERADRSAMAMVLGQSNDALGYIIQSFEYDTQGGAVTEYGTQTGEYEETFSADRCLGDHVLDVALASTDALGFGR